VGYEYLDISGDAGIRAAGDNLDELFINAALGMYGLVTDPESIRGETAVIIDVKSHSIEGLLVGWLNELIFQLDTYGFIGRKVKILKLGDEDISAEVTGEEFDPGRHERRLLLKAATYHGLRIEKHDGGWTAEVIFDI
jgi:SHS2 domain-containing protein